MFGRLDRYDKTRPILGCQTSDIARDLKLESLRELGDVRSALLGELVPCLDVYSLGERENLLVKVVELRLANRGLVGRVRFCTRLFGEAAFF